jgi:hypothetical protein
MSLNPEPAAPEERAELHLPPKSYADAAEEALEPVSHANGTDGAHDTVERAMHGLRHNAEDVKTNGINSFSEPDTEKLEGVGQDASPKSPTPKGHRRKGSRSSMGSSPRRNGGHTYTELVEEQPNGNGDALVTVKPSRELEKDRRVDFERRKPELKSGRQAGAGWATSKCVYYAHLNDDRD